MLNFIFWAVCIGMVALIIWLTMKYGLLHDQSKAVKRPFSFSRVQLAWWTMLILTAFIVIALITGKMAEFNESSLILLGIGSLTTVSGRLIDISDEKSYKEATASPAIVPLLSQDQPSNGFFMDILSDASGISIHRLQAFIFNLVFGVWFIYQVWTNIQSLTTSSLPEVINAAIPVIAPKNLILLGVSAGTYISIKTIENKKSA